MNNSNICDGNRIIFVRKDVAKGPALDENGKIICPYNSIFFIKKDNVNSENLDKPLEVVQENVKNNISSKTVNDVHSVSESCVFSEEKVSHSSQQPNLSETNLSNKKITNVVDSEIKDNDDKETSSTGDKSTSGFCCDNLSTFLSVLGLITGVALAILGGVLWTPVCLGIGISLAALSVYVLYHTRSKMMNLG